MTPAEKCATLTNATAAELAKSIALAQISSSTSMAFQLRLPCHSGITRLIGDAVADCMRADGWKVEFADTQTSSAAAGDSPEFVGQILVYSVTT